MSSFRCSRADERPWTRFAAAWLAGPLVIALVVTGIVAGGGCGRIQASHRLRAEPLGAAKRTVRQEGVGYQLRARRQGAEVWVEAKAVHYCRDVITQRARGFRVTTRRAVGPSLVMEWVMGGLITSAGVGVMAYGAANPPTFADGELNATGTDRTSFGGGVMTAVGLGLLTAALVQQRSLGTSELDMGAKMLKKQGPERICQRSKATTGRVRLTLADGLQIEADIGADGRARLQLPTDVEQRLQREGRRATLEAHGDWRSQLRISL